MVLGFPVRFMQEYVGKEVCYVYVARFSQGEHSCPWFPVAPAVVMPQAKIAVHPRSLYLAWCRDRSLRRKKF